jgi:hypothetical protein
LGNKPLSPTDDVIVTGDDVAAIAPIDVVDDVDAPEGVVVIMTCVVGAGEASVYIVDVVNAIVGLTFGEGEGEGEAGGGGGGFFGGGGGSCPSRTAENGGGTTLTVAHCCVNQTEVDWRSAEVQFRAKQGTARTKNP